MPVYLPKLIFFAENKRIMNLIEFTNSFPDEESCKLKFKEYREHVGVICPKCNY